ENRGAGGIPLALGAAVCAPGKVPGGSAAVVVFAWHFHRRHARGVGRARGQGGCGAVGLGGGAAEGALERGVPRLAPLETRQGALGVLVGRWHLFGASGRGRAAV